MRRIQLRVRGCSAAQVPALVCWLRGMSRTVWELCDARYDARVVLLSDLVVRVWDTRADGRDEVHMRDADLI